MVQVNTANRIEVVNPATLERIGEVPIQSFEEVRAAVERGRRAFESWSRLSFKERAGYVNRIKDYLLEHREDVAKLIMSETGKPKMEALNLEITYMCLAIDYYTKQAEKILRDQRRPTHWLVKTKRVHVSYHPIGVVGIIGPWNFPLILTLGDAIPALMAGNTVIIKPSEITPFTGLLCREICEKVGFPPDVLQVVTGDGSTGAALVENVDMISFTGSVATGKRVAELAAKRLIPVSLELGGKDPMIVLKDADLERAANAAVWGAFANAGQICMSVERVYVEEPVAEEFTRLVVEKTKQLRQGIDQDYSVDVGSMTFPRQLQTVERHVNDAVRKGAKVLAGGQRNPNLPGLFYEPTVLTDVDHNMEIMTDETFGPVLPIMRVRDEREALRLANDSRYGLNSSIWTRDKNKARVLARSLQAGAVCINDCIVNYIALGVPFGGVKESGIGRRHGEEGIKKFCYQQSVLIDQIGLKQEVSWYPYKKSTAMLMQRLVNFFFRNKRRR